MFKISHYPNNKMSMCPKIFQFSNVATYENLLEYQTGHIGAIMSLFLSARLS